MQIKVTVTVETTNAIGEPITTVSTTSEAHAGDNPRFVPGIVGGMVRDLADTLGQQVVPGVSYRPPSTVAFERL